MQRKKTGGRAGRAGKGGRTPVARSSRGFRIALEEGRRGLAGPREGHVLEIPDRPSRLVLDGGGEPPHLAGTARGEGAVAEDRAAWFLEPVHRRRELSLLVVCPGALSGRAPALMRINGEFRTRLASLRDRDVIEFGGTGWTGRLSLLSDYVIGFPPAAVLGAACPICRQVLAEDTQVLLCPACGAAVHAEDGTSDEALRCLDLCSECPSCSLPLPSAGATGGRAAPGATEEGGS